MGLLAGYRTGASAAGQIEKRDPLPVGRYWIDVFGKDYGVFLDWTIAHKATVTVVKTEQYDTTSDWNLFDDREAGAWFLFEVSAPTSWGIASDVGWPNTAPSNIQSSQDTIQSPPLPKNILDDGGDAIPKWVPWVGVGVGAVMLTMFLISRND